MGGEEDDEEDTSAFACVHWTADSQLPTHEEIFPGKKKKQKTKKETTKTALGKNHTTDFSSFQTQGALHQ